MQSNVDAIAFEVLIFIKILSFTGISNLMSLFRLTGRVNWHY